MGKVTGFKEFKREDFGYQNIKKRITNFSEFIVPLSKKELEIQSARCMDCGIPFCHSSYGCPLGNIIPQFNDLVYKERWEDAFRNLMSTNNFPEFTGRVCPAPCETACVLGLNEDAVTIKNIEYAIIEKAYAKGWMKSLEKVKQTGKKIAIVGSGPAGLACADQLNKVGHEVTIFEKESRFGGLLRYGIPNFKLDKVKIIQRRIEIMKEEGIIFLPNKNIGVDFDVSNLEDEFDAIILAIGAGKPRDLNLDNRDAKGIHFAMEFLSQTNSLLEGDTFSEEALIVPKDKTVLVIGGGDTGSDCVGTSVRKGAKNVIQIEINEKPSEKRDENTPWPTYPRLFKLSSSQEEGCSLEFSVLTKSFIKNENGEVCGVNCVRIDWSSGKAIEIQGSEFAIKADLIFLALGFLGAKQDCVIDKFSLDTDDRTNIKTTYYQTSKPKVFACGDARRGQSLVVWAILEGRECALLVDEYLSGKRSMLNQKSNSLYEF